LRTRLGRDFGAPCLGVVPRLDDPQAAAVAAHLELPASGPA
jgi:dethiobiotin synthetase